MSRRRCLPLCLLAALTAFCAWGLSVAPVLAAAAAEPAPRRNVVLVLSDDHRYDFLGFLPNAPKFLETPHMDRMAAEGAHLANAFVSTSLCSPSRASILTGQYMHHHRVVDNQRPVPAGTVFFPQYLRESGYATAFVGKWHMGHDDDAPQPGFDHWVSFRGQGEYFDPVLNINGRRETIAGYTADVLTDRALQWLQRERDTAKPFFLYLSHKSVHYPFQPAPRHQGRYDKEPIDYPETMANTEGNYQTQPRWVRERRYSIHGIDHMETGAFDKDPVPNFDDLYHRYCETVHSLDENLGRVLKYLDESGLSRNTLVLYMGDNGFELGEHGFYDKRDAFEVSIRVPLLAYAPGLIAPGTKVSPMVQNIDIGPTILEACGVAVPRRAHGRALVPAVAARPASPVAGPHPVRVPLGMELPGHAHQLRDPHRSLQIHLLPRHLGPERFLRLADRPLGTPQPDRRPRLPRANRRPAEAAVRRAGSLRRLDPAGTPARRRTAGSAEESSLHTVCTSGNQLAVFRERDRRTGPRP